MYGRVFGRAFLFRFHQILINLALHGIGYDNARTFSYTGEMWFINKILKKENIEVAFDVGANVGSYSEHLVKELGCKVYAIEPASLSFTSLQKIALEHPTIHPIQTAISDRTGTAVMFSNTDRSETATLGKELSTSASKEEVVSVTTFDELVAQLHVQKIDFIKVDTEGFEREVFSGMRNTLLELRPRYIQFEFNVLQLYRGYTLREVTLLLPGYEFYRLLPRGWLHIDPNAFRDNIFMYSNVVAVRK